MSQKISLKEVIKNLMYSFTSFAMPTAVLQFLIQPLLARELGAEMNGQYLTIMSFHYFMVGITATVLNHVRLLQQEEYEKKKLRGDFNIFLLIYAFVAIIAVPLSWLYFTKTVNVTDVSLMLLVAFFYIYHDYIFAEYRLKLQYNKILINNILMSVGYVLGFFIFRSVRHWQIIFIVAYAIPTVYDLINTTFIKEPISKTPLFRQTAKKVLTLTCSTSLGSLTTYCDKLILYPLLGGVSVSVYYSAAIVGKLLLLVSSPMNSVLLSYLVKIKQLDKQRIAKKVLPLLGLFVLAYVCCVAIGYPLTSFLYPEWAEQSKFLIPLTVAASMFSLIANLLNTIVLRFCKTSYQVVIQIVSLVIYLVISLFSLHFWGLFGFCAAVTCANALKTIILLLIICFKKTVINSEEEE